MNSVSIRLPDELGERLKSLAEKTGRTKTYYIIEAIENHLEDLEDIYIAEQMIERIRSGKERTYTLEEVEAHLALDD